MIDLIVTTVALVAAIAWAVYAHVKLTSVETEIMLLKIILTDVAKGEANVWIENGEVVASRTAD